jgi:DNA-binding transcriptional ArsR family regulator
MLDGVISSKTKVNILVKLFLNPMTRAYMRELASEFGVSTNAVRIELGILKKSGLLVAEKDGRNIYYMANRDHPIYPELCSIVRKITGIDSLLNSVVERLGNLEAVYITGDYARGRNSGIIDTVLVGNINRIQLEDVLNKTERYIDRKIRVLVLSRSEFDELAASGVFNPIMLLWQELESSSPNR